MALEIRKRPVGSLPSDIEIPQREGKEHVKVVTLRSAKSYLENTQKEQKEPSKAEIEKINVVQYSVTSVPDFVTTIPVNHSESTSEPQTIVKPIDSTAIQERSEFPLLFPDEPKTTQTPNENIVVNVSQSGDSPTFDVQTSPIIPCRTESEPILHINIPLIEAFEQMSSYAKFLKDILCKKKKLNEYETVVMTEGCSALLSSKIPPKLKDPRSFTIPCSIGGKEIGKALCDLGASINLMPLSVFNTLGIGEARPTIVTLQLADKSITYPRRKIEDVLVQVKKFIFPADFIILDFEADKDISIILGRPFLATERTPIDVQKGELTMRVQDQQVTFNVSNSLRYPEESEECSTLGLIETWCQEKSLGEISSLFESNSDEEEDFEEIETPQDSAAFEVLENEDRNTLVTSLDVAPYLGLKQLPSYLKYAFLGDAGKLPVIISSSLETNQEKKLVDMLKLHTRP
ncbi:uncharacterized protein LOC112511316 [Cynara cardunculus var. scolymus]|uniref:uncharacterized protein LOC112511316 n=1 Tax=Cynara cardunculus var. scolymus TaxID=59895 RepID=UPI000D62549E|nr:uncharacterized protein LOC112511316 [Cynara cardunculus var. scolymus]